MQRFVASASDPNLVMILANIVVKKTDYRYGVRSANVKAIESGEKKIADI